MTTRWRIARLLSPKAREKGDVPRSRELNAAIGLLLGLLTLKFFGTFIAEGLQDLSRSTLTQLNHISVDPLTLNAYFAKLVLQVSLITAPIFVVMVAVSILVNVLQVGPLLSTEALGFNFEKLNPLNGLKLIFSMHGLVETAKALLKFLIVGSIAFLTIWNDLIYFQSLGSKGIRQIFNYGASLSFKIGMRVALALVLLGILDLLYQRWSHAQKLKMTRQEVKEERKESEVAPEVKRVIQARQLSAAQRRMMKEVPKADVVITNPTHIAVALTYDHAVADSPIVVAKGAGFIAEKIKEVAREHDVPIIEDKPVARTLYENVELGEMIPVELYQTVAQLLARVYRMRGKYTEA